MMELWKAALFAIPILFVGQCIQRFLKGRKATDGLRGVRCAFGPLSFWGAMLGSRSWNPGLDYMWNKRKELYQKYGTDTISVVPYISGTPFVMTSNLEVTRQITAVGGKAAFYKPESVSSSLLLFGKNVATHNGDEWRRHRRIINPAFNPATFALVWKETARIYSDMMKGEGWFSQDEVFVPGLHNYTLKFAFFVITACGFGLPFNWNDPPMSGEGLSIAESMRYILDNNLLFTVTPKWAYYLPIKKLHKLARANVTLNAFMLEQVAQRKNEMKRQLMLPPEDMEIPRDVFSRLALATVQDAKLGLSDEELIGNVFVMLFAGHETTASTLMAVMGYLAIYQHLQEEAYEQIKAVCGDRDPVFEDYAKLNKVLACFLEALRLVPSGSLMIRHTVEDTVLVVDDPQAEGGQQQLALKKGTQVVVDVIGLQYNPKYFPEPNEYRPSRWYVTPENPRPLDTYTAFSFGPRVCIGHMFSKTEAVSFLALMLRDWHLDIKLNAGETREQYRDRVMQAHFMMTLTPYDLPVLMKRRKS